MQKPDHHIFVCASFRGTEAKGQMHQEGAVELTPYIEDRTGRPRLNNVMVSTTGCLKLCEEGPVMIVYPQAYWYRGVAGEDGIDAILDGLENGGPGEEVFDNLIDLQFVGSLKSFLHEDLDLDVA